MTDNTFYTEKYLLGREAVIDATSFPFWERKASNEVRKYTFGNINENGTIPEVVQLCVCELTEYLYKQDNKDHDDDVVSEKKAEWSTTYVSAKESNELKQSRTKEIIYNWLANTGLLYRGCY